MVHGILLTKVPFADVDDLVHDTFVKALRKLSTLRDNGSFGPWLAAIARNLANDHYRRRAPEAPLEEEFAAAEAGASPEPADISRERARSNQESAGVLPRAVDSSSGGRHDGPGNRRAHWIDAGLGPREFASRDAAPPRQPEIAAARRSL